MRTERTLSMAYETFSRVLQKYGIQLKRGRTEVLQVNVGLLCNLSCRHCHLEAGPVRKEVMDRETVEAVIDYAGRTDFQAADVTGGAPELNPHLLRLIEGLAERVPRLMLRSNLVVPESDRPGGLWELCAAKRVVLVGSLPASNPSQMEAQRGQGVWARVMETMKTLNALGYGMPDTGLELDLVANPVGAFLPPSQSAAGEKFRRDLARRHGVSFSTLFVFANAPLGRFRQWLERSGNFDAYMDRLATSFNPCTVDGLMCRSLVSVAWDGTLFDCDFNQACDLPMSGRRVHVSELSGKPAEGTAIAVSDHCYACTAGSGFT